MGSQEGLYSAYVFYIILGCVVAVFIGYSLDYIATNGFRDYETTQDMSMEQKQYMREVRDRNTMRLLEQVNRGGR
ncbi:uncharacterized protein N7496_004045 [Penicillium cataractarum]|uniref:Uncharacterized protein n=1 Tax=Penicillium cataractarum TaxID=2100454 RepID=A0A9W9SNN3_9EURO|nr:uncharacterized protein N7496_004045 [Penicillium cataractarum]KAJ5381617.1 hypothetical protein N7496_004045 [Penicillium cataractarum]